MMDSRGKDTLIKVGRTTNLNNRLLKYRTHNPLAKLVATYNNPKWDEKGMERYAHTYFQEKEYQRVGETEWYYITKGEKKQWRKQGFTLMPLFEQNLTKFPEDAIHTVATIDNKTGRKRR